MAKSSSLAKPLPKKAPLYGKKAEKPTSTGENIAKKATNWLFFWLVAGIEIAKDLLDLIWDALDAVGVGLSATVVGSVVGIPISVFSIGMSWLMSLTVFIITMVYFVYTRQSVMLRLVIISISTIIGMIPMLNILPDATAGFFVAAFTSAIAKVGNKIIEGAANKTKKIITGS